MRTIKKRIIGPGFDARTVLDMLTITAGIFAGLLIAFGPLSFLATPVDNLNNTLVRGGDSMIEALLGLIGPEAANSDAGLVMQVILSALIPGLVTVVLVLVAKGAANVRRGASFVIVLFGLSTFFFMPSGDALSLFLLSLVVSVLLAFAEGLFITIPLVALATVLGVRYGVALWSGDVAAIAQGALTLSGISGGGGLEFWRVVMMVAAASPFVFAIKAAFTEAPRKKKKD